MAPTSARSPAARAARQEALILAPRVGWIASLGTAGEPLVDWPGNAAGPLAARSVLALDPDALARAAVDRQPAVLLFEEGDPARPLLVGLVASSTPLLDAVLSRPAPEPAPRDTLEPRRVLDARDELVLRCGKASITLRANGKVVVRGSYVETRSDGVNRIKGGNVKIN
jgi:hypothetical protein